MSITLQIALYSGITALVVFLFIIFYHKEDRVEINRFMFKLVLYSLPLVILIGLFLINLKMMSKALNGISMENQLIQSFGNVLKKPYKTIIMGNSRTYRGINPEVMDSTTYNFSFDNETFFEQYYKLLYLDSNNALPETLILGVDYFEFSFLSAAMSQTYSNYFVPEYDSLVTVISAADGVAFRSIDNIDDWFNDKMTAVFGRGASQYLSYLVRKIAGKPLQAPYLKDNGQYIISPIPKAYEGQFMTRSSVIKQYQKEKFEEIINFTKQNDVDLILLMPPCRSMELNCYTEEFKDGLDNYLNSFEGVKFFNLSKIQGFSTKDYMDETHLTPDAADRFSKTLYTIIKQ